MDISNRTLTAVPLGYYETVTPAADSTDTLSTVTVTKVDATRDTAIRDALVTAGLLTKNGNQYTPAATARCQTVLDTNNYVSWAAKCLTDSTSSPWAGKLRDFVTALDTAMGATPGGTALTPVEGAKNKQKVTNLKPGLYVVFDRTSADGVARSIPMVIGTDVVADSNTYTKLNTQVLGTIEYKATDKPTFDKNILEDLNETPTPSDYTDDTKKKTNEVNIGDTVTFELSVTVPPTAGYSKFWLQLSDTLSEGLTFGEIKSVKSGTTDLVEGTDYKIVGTGNAGAVAAVGDGTTSFDIYFAPVADSEPTESDILQTGMTTKFAANSVIKVIYTATLNGDAIIESTGNPNEVTLTYSNNPNDTTKKKTTPPVTTRTYTGQFSICKVDMGGEKLTGAQFSLYRGDNANGAALAFTGSAGVYALPPAGSTATTVTTLDADTNGCIKFSGLKSDDYTIKETKAPSGYSSNFLPTVALTLTVTEPATANSDNAYSSIAEKSGDTNNLVDLAAEKQVTVSSSSTVSVSDTANVKNVRNITELPKTGAAWLAIYAFGALVFAGCGTLLMFIGRRNRENV